ncbi:MAG: hypothetical protein AAGA56_06890 [Myxococcota bacterium]
MVEMAVGLPWLLVIGGVYALSPSTAKGPAATIRTTAALLAGLMAILEPPHVLFERTSRLVDVQEQPNRDAALTFQRGPIRLELMRALASIARYYAAFSGEALLVGAVIRPLKEGRDLQRWELTGTEDG